MCLVLVPASSALKLPMKGGKGLMPKPTVTIAAEEISGMLSEECTVDDDASCIAVNMESAPEPPLKNAFLLAMQEEGMACLVAVAIIAATASPAQAMDAFNAELFTPQMMPTTLFIFFSGIAASVSMSRAMHNELAREAATHHASTDQSSSSKPTEYKDWLAGRPLPSLEELADSCVLVASGPNGHWAMCLTPGAQGGKFDSSCEPDETFSAYYEQPIYICPV